MQQKKSNTLLTVRINYYINLNAPDVSPWKTQVTTKWKKSTTNKKLLKILSQSRWKHRIYPKLSDRKQYLGGWRWTESVGCAFHKLENSVMGGGIRRKAYCWFSHPHLGKRRQKWGHFGSHSRYGKVLVKLSLAQLGAYWSEKIEVWLQFPH